MNSPEANVEGPASETSSVGDLARRLSFSRQLQHVTNRIHSTDDIDQIMLDVSQDICKLFSADRLTIYVLDEQNNLVSRVKMGLNAFGAIQLPLKASSVAGYVGLHRQVVNVRDVYDAAELSGFSPEIRFNQTVDQRTGYRTRQMLVAPIVDDEADRLIGVIQIINNLAGKPFDDIAESGVRELAETLAIAFRQRKKASRGPRSRFSGLLEDGRITTQELEEAISRARENNESPEEVLLGDYGIKLEYLGQSYASYFRLPYQPYNSEHVKPADLLKNFNRAYATSAGWIPYDDIMVKTDSGAEERRIVIVTSSPERIEEATVKQVVKWPRIETRICTNREFEQILDLFYGATFSDDGTNIEELTKALGAVENNEEEESDDADRQAAENNELVQLVNKIIIDGYKRNASDIHIEPAPGREKTLVRFRIDGDLMDYIRVPASSRNALITRLKIMCDLDISERRKPQDGKIKFKRFVPNLDIELRVATVPTVGGLEDVVMRILASGEPLPLDKLGLLPNTERNVKDIVSKPYGLFFVCGPTGSGKTTTLHSILKFINTPETKIWTAEDPVEITQKGLRQVQMNPKAGLTFATAMRAFLRADPDVIMVGEMRDKETVATGIEASLTGHLVFSTLHTNSAPESIIRLLDMGMDPFNFSDALLGVLAQRLGKRLCGNCKLMRPATADEIRDLLSEYSFELKQTESWKRNPKEAYEKIFENWKKTYADEKGRFMLAHANPDGCEKCNKTGYKGRVGLHELLVGTDLVKKRIQEHARVAEILATCLEEGMRTLKQDGIEKVLLGITDIHSVRSVCIK